MSLKKLEKLNNHKRDLRIKFDSKNHIYSVDKNKNYISVTQLVSKFFPEFDKDFWAEKQSHKLGIPKDEIISKGVSNELFEPKSTQHLIYCSRSKAWHPIILLSTMFKIDTKN